MFGKTPDATEKATLKTSEKQPPIIIIITTPQVTSGTVRRSKGPRFKSRTKIV